jgi:hypothetical protein
MASLNAKKARSALLKKGFVLEDEHHHYYEFWYNEKLIARTRMSHNDQDLNNYLISAMSRQCLLKKNDFLNLIKCPLSQDDYIEILREQGALK